jgi:hypothetical protein
MSKALKKCVECGKIVFIKGAEAHYTLCGASCVSAEQHGGDAYVKFRLLEIDGEKTYRGVSHPFCPLRFPVKKIG